MRGITENTWVGDLESDGFLDKATIIWCGVFINAVTGEERSFDVDRGIEELLPPFLDGVDAVIMHNGIAFDKGLLKGVYGYDLHRDKIIDTLILSKLLNPDRRVPPEWKGIHKPHSIEAWGMRFGIPKPENEDWSEYTPHMLHRCREDVVIGGKVYHYLMKEEME